MGHNIVGLEKKSAGQIYRKPLYKWDHHRSCWCYKDKVPDLADKFLRYVNPYQFADAFKMTYECFIVLVDW